MDSITNDLIYSWRGKLKNLSDKGFKDEFIHFFIYYMCLDAWITNESGEDSDEKKLRWLINNEGVLRRVFVNSEFDKTELIGLKAFLPIKDMRPKHFGEYREIQDKREFEKNYEDVVYTIYQIRCNLFHGGKNPASGRDRDIVNLGGVFLEKWIECAHSKFNSSVR